MNVFYCTRCGVRLQLEESFAGGPVACPHCRTTVRSPALADQADAAVDELAAAVRESAGGTLSYAGPDIARRTRGTGLSPRVVADIAAKLASVEPGEAKEDGSMTNCPYCDSTIAPYVGKCPYCRHPLRGR